MTQLETLATGENGGVSKSPLEIMFCAFTGSPPSKPCKTNINSDLPNGFTHHGNYEISISTSSLKGRGGDALVELIGQIRLSEAYLIITALVAASEVSGLITAR